MQSHETIPTNHLVRWRCLYLAGMFLAVAGIVLQLLLRRLDAPYWIKDLMGPIVGLCGIIVLFVVHWQCHRANIRTAQILTIRQHIAVLFGIVGTILGAILLDAFAL